ncbi:MAG TPA: hypothetical protein DCP11_07525 [Microbacteriaceae bacterium]|nr:hypothetical protein [Microbacteriaceae bacterium]
MARYVALLRGINVGTAKAVSMSDLAAVFADLGFGDVATLLRSGNVVFSSHPGLASDAPASIEAAVLAATGVQSSVLVLAAADFAAIAEANPLRAVATDGSKSFVTFVSSMPESLELPDEAGLAPEILVAGERAIYQWMPNGSQKTRVPQSFWKQFDGTLTARNWNTVTKLIGLLAD